MTRLSPNTGLNEDVNSTSNTGGRFAIKYFDEKWSVELARYWVSQEGDGTAYTKESEDDAADQCSLSRIWGGIHPPADDIPGRLIGREVGLDAFELADRYFQGEPD